jgi:hypothetical protein
MSATNPARFGRPPEWEQPAYPKCARFPCSGDEPDPYDDTGDHSRKGSAMKKLVLLLILGAIVFAIVKMMGVESEMS